LIDRLSVPLLLGLPALSRHVFTAESVAFHARFKPPVLANPYAKPLCTHCLGLVLDSVSWAV